MKFRHLLLLPVAILASCSNETPSTEGNDTLKNDTLQEKVELLETNSSLPSPLRVAAMFKRSGLKYLPGITFPVEKAAGYSTNFSKARIMGVYSADMAYNVLNKQTNEGQKCLKATRDIGTQINLGKVFDQTNLFDRFNKNLDNEDSLGSIIAEIQYQTDLQLEQNQQNELYGIIFSGAWVESMYIGAQVYRKEGNDNIVQALFEQMAVLKNITEELNQYKDKDPAIEGWVTELNGLQAVFNELPSVKKLNENQDLEFKDVTPKKDELEPLIKKIESLRELIIKG
ncbi:MAG: hypothetical protein Fur0041_10110 [Bacteroidia bacterium]